MTSETVVESNASTRYGVMPLVVRVGDTIAFKYPIELDARDRHRARRAAVAWIATNPSRVIGVTRFRFDAGLVVNAF